MFTSDQRKLQDAFDSRRLADRIEERLVEDHLDEDAQAFVRRQIMFFLATVDADGRPNCSFKGGAAGFVRILDPKTLAFPDYNGNGMFLSLGNVQATQNVGMLFIDFQDPERFRVNGEASIDPDDPLLADFPGAQMIVRVRIREAFPNCSRYIPKMDLREPSRFLPKAGESAPIPDWKKSDWARDVLPET